MEMIDIYLTGRWPQKKRFEEYVEYVLFELLNYREPNYDWVIQLEMKHNLKFGSYQSAGECYSPCSGIVMIDIARNFIHDDGEVEPHDVSYIALTVAHELVHTKQHICNDWNKYQKEFNMPCVALNDIFEYKELPWEEEAYAEQEVLIDLF